MHRIILTLLLTAISSTAWAEWEEAGEDKLATVYVDRASITSGKKSDHMEMWHLLNYMTVQSAAGTQYSSARIHMAYDCKKMKLRNLGLTWHAEKMGAGNEVFSRTLFGEWRRPLPHSVDEALLGIVCEKK